MELTVQNVYGLLLRSKLLSVEDAQTLFTRWQEEAKDNANNITRFAAWMVAKRYVTEYQASLLVRGHAESFFLGDYKILERLGKGRMAGVYKAQHRLGQVVAIKVLPPSKAHEPALLSRFKREARLLLKLKHPNIVRAFQVGDSAGLNYLVMEYLEGETLEEVMARRRAKFLPGEAVRLIHQALQGLHHIHQQGLVHRDLKPANLMLITGPGAAPNSTLRSTVKILDIGLGRELFDESVPEKSLDPALTGEGMLLGTPDYMAPEQARNARAADIRSDVYSLGCVLYHLLAGVLPFPDTNIISQMIRHATETAKPVKDHNPAVPDALQQIINRMLAKDPAQRYATPERAARAMQVFLAAGADPLAMPESDPQMRPFLQWLEVEDKKEPRSPSAGPTTVTNRSPERQQKRAQMRASLVTKIKAKMRAKMQAEIARRLAKAGGMQQKPEDPKKPGVGKKKRDKKKGSPSPAVPTALASPLPTTTAAKANVTADVELVTMPPAAAGRRLSRRDLVACGIGVLAGAIATAVGGYFAVRKRLNEHTE